MEERRYAFYKQLLETLRRSNKCGGVFDNISPRMKNCVEASAGNGLHWVFVVMKSERNHRVEMRLDHPDSNVNKLRFENLRRQKAEMEERFGSTLTWDFNRFRKHQYIKSNCPFHGLGDRENWPRIQQDLVDRMERLQNAIGAYVESLK